MVSGYIKKYKYSYLFGMLVLLLVDYLGLFIPQYTGDITDGLTIGGMDYHGMLLIIGKILLAGAGMALGRFGWRYFIFGAARKIEYELRNDMFEHLSNLSMRYYNEHKTGDLMAHFTNDLAAIRMSLGPAVISTFDAVVMTIMVIAKMIFHINLGLTLLACIPMVFILFGGIRYGRAAERRFSEKQKAFSDMTDQVQESISGIRVIKAFVQEKKENEAFAMANQNNKDKNLKVVKLQAVIMPLLDVIIGISSVITLLYGGHLVLQGRVTAGEFVAFSQYVNMLVWPMIAVGDSITSFSQGFASMKRVEKIFAEEPEILDYAKKETDISSLRGEISIKGLNFSYQQDRQNQQDRQDRQNQQNRQQHRQDRQGSQNENLVLKDINVKIQRGETLAVLGRTGSGKTTLANLLVRMYDAEDGMILMDGHNIKDIPLTVLRESVAYVPQDNFLFSDTLQTNIAFGVRKLSDIPPEAFEDGTATAKIFMSHKERLEEYLEKDFFRTKNRLDEAYHDIEPVMEAAKKACIHDNIMDFPKKYSTMVGERGVTISGGQKQRSSIARALMKNAPILILDDSLSAVDTDTEEKILESLKKDRAGKTTIIIAHRISTIQNADHILVLDHGGVAEYGTHAELVEAGGIYAALYKKQQLEKQLETA